MRLAAAVWLTLVAGGCAANRNAAVAYRDLGKDELALAYFNRAFTEAGDSDEAKDDITGTTKRLLLSLGRADQERSKLGDFQGALGAVLRAIDVARSVQRVTRIDITALAARAEELYRRAGDAALHALDASELSNDVNARRELGLFERAMAYAEDDAELSGRYATLRERTTKRVRLRNDCPDPDPSAKLLCRTLTAGVAARLAAVRGSLVKLVSDDSAELEVSIQARAERAAGQWTEVGAGQAETRVPQRDRFNEIVKDKNGRTVEDTVKASYRSFRRTASASARAGASVRDLRQTAQVFSDQFSARAEEQRSYVEWSGDERAVAAQRGSLGTDKTPPKTPDILLAEATETVADAIAKRLQPVIEGRIK